MIHSLILIYHRVADLQSDPHQLAVSPANFDAQLDALCQRWQVLPLQELVLRLAAGKPVAGYLSITFDDGYADNLQYALPRLEKHGLPATFFVVSGMTGSRRGFWWDELDAALAAAQRSRRTLYLGPQGQAAMDGPALWLRAWVDRLRRRSVEKQLCWPAGEGEDAAQKRRELDNLVRRLTTAQRDALIDRLFALLGLEREQVDPRQRAMNMEELRRMAALPLVEIGSHTLTHPCLARETPAVQGQEIEESRRLLAEWTGKEIASFSYPFGTLQDVMLETVELVRQAGYALATANVQGNLSYPVERYFLPRRLVRNWDAEEFSRRLDGFCNLPSVHYFAGGVFSQAGRAAGEFVDQLSKVPAAVGEQDNRSVVFFNQVDVRGGAAQAASVLAQGLQARGFQVRWLVGKKQSQSEQVDEITVDGSPQQELLHAYQLKEGWGDVFHLSSLKLAEHPFLQSAGVVHFHNPHAGYLSLLALPRLAAGKTALWTLHDQYAITGRCINSLDCLRWQTGCGDCPYPLLPLAALQERSDFTWRLKEIVYRYLDVTLVCPSPWLRDMLPDSLLAGKPAQVIYNGVDESVFKEIDRSLARNRLGLPADPFIVLFVVHGWANSIKGMAILHELASHYRNEKMLFLTLGGKGLEAANLRTYPYIEDDQRLALFYSAADMLVYPSMMDNCPLVVLEAMACSRPAAVYPTGGIPEFIRHMETGWIVESKDLAGVISSIEKFRSNPELGMRLGNQARQAVLRSFTRQKMVDRYAELYERCANDRPRRRFDGQAYAEEIRSLVTSALL